ncbi:MAG: hypothetical protein KAS40_17445 [Desulfobacterales bacterium]|nr:hypothetical protein [Desulfobacterales bacterium]
MKSTAKPLRSTIVWGLIGGLGYIPLCSALSLMVFWPLGFHLSLWALLAGYAILLSRWASRPLKSIGLPLLLLLLSAFLIKSATVFLFTALVMLSWIRSGICFKRKPLVKRLGAEMGLGLGSGLLVSGAVPGVTLVWALGVWLFFLIQALYFVLFEYSCDPQIEIDVDPFEKSKMAAETILSNGGFLKNWTGLC